MNFQNFLLIIFTMYFMFNFIKMAIIIDNNIYNLGKYICKNKIHLCFRGVNYEYNQKNS